VDSNVSDLEIHRYSSSLAHNSILDYNLYSSTSSFYELNSISYNLSEWKSYYGQDENSVAANPTFINTNFSQISDFELMSSSVGFQSASD